MAKNDTTDKTNAMRILEAAGADYTAYSYRCEHAISAVEVAELLGIEKERVFKTLVTQGKSGEHYVFMLPAAEELDLKKAAAAVGEKSITMLKSKDLFGLTGYVHGGCSPIGMKKQFRTVIDETVQLFDKIVFSGGRIGRQVEISPDLLASIVPIEQSDLTV